MILPAANSGQASWAEYQDRYNDPEYGGLIAAEEYVNDHQRMQQISPYQGNTWSPGWISMDSGQQGGQQGTPTGQPSAQQPAQPVQVPANQLSLGGGGHPLGGNDNPGWSVGSPIFNPQTGRYESPGTVWVGSGKGPSEADMAWLQQAQPGSTGVTQRDAMNQRVAMGTADQNFNIGGGNYVQGGSTIDWGAYDQANRAKMDQAIMAKYQAGTLTPAQKKKVEAGLLGSAPDSSGGLI